MGNGTVALGEAQRQAANEGAVKRLEGIEKDARSTLIELRKRVATAYWVIIVFSVLTFLAGLVLLSVPVVAAYGGDIEDTKALIAAGFGIADLAALFLFKPTERVQKLMADMAQIALALNAYGAVLNLRLLEMDLTQRPSIGTAAESIEAAAKSGMFSIHNYLEATEPK